MRDFIADLEKGGLFSLSGWDELHSVSSNVIYKNTIILGHETS